MFEGIEKTIVITAVVLWFAQGWYMNEKLKSVHAKLDALMGAHDDLKEYLYEIDPQFDDERERLDELHNGHNEFVKGFGAMGHMDLVAEKKARGKRTLY